MFSINPSSQPSGAAAERLLEALRQAITALPSRQPLAVLLSGGVDSAVLMELAWRTHPQVTAIILGKPGSPDYVTALRLCEERGYQYRVLMPHSTDLIALVRPALKRLGITTVITGIGADELLAGDTQALWLSEQDIATYCRQQVATIEKEFEATARTLATDGITLVAPFLSKEVQELGLALPAELKIHREHHRVVTKYVLRVVARQFLPEYISSRYPLPWPYGAGLGFDQSAIKLPAATTKHLIVAEFEKLPLYYPLYHAAHRGLYTRHDLQVEFVSTGGDDVTYTALLTGSADIGVADPIFSQAEHFAHKGTVLGELVGQLPLKAVTLRPDITIVVLEDLQQYRLGTFQSYTTTHTAVTYLLPKANLHPGDFRELTTRLQRREIDIAVVIPELAAQLVALGGRVVYDFAPEFPHFLFSGLFTAQGDVPSHAKRAAAFLAAIKESMKDIHANPTQALAQFQAEFPEQLGSKALFEELLTIWSKNLKVHARGLNRSRQVWHSVYPWLVKTSAPVFTPKGPEDKIVALLTAKRFSRSSPHREDQLRSLISRALDTQQPLPVVMYWGASDKSNWNTADEEALQQLLKLQQEVQTLHQPGLAVTVILSDEHARRNGFSEPRYRAYLATVEQKLQQQGITTLWLSSLWRRWRIRDDIIETWRQRLSQRESSWWRSISFHRALEQSARRYTHGEDTVRQAQQYYVMRTLESKHLQQQFPEAIFLTYTADIQQGMLPDLPTLYVWVAPGTSHVPWFEKVIS